jgi:hypothetical protein
MAHFAEIDDNNVVLRVIVVSNDDCKDADGNESEAVGAAFCNNLLGGTWKQTSYNSNMRVRYAGIGYSYNEDLDAFIAPKPFPSWTLNEDTADWEAPTPRPTEGFWSWNEDAQEWQEQNLGE